VKEDHKISPKVEAARPEKGDIVVFVVEECVVVVIADVVAGRASSCLSQSAASRQEKETGNAGIGQEQTKDSDRTQKFAEWSWTSCVVVGFFCCCCCRRCCFCC